MVFASIRCTASSFLYRLDNARLTIYFLSNKYSRERTRDLQNTNNCNSNKFITSVTFIKSIVYAKHIFFLSIKMILCVNVEISEFEALRFSLYILLL